MSSDLTSPPVLLQQRVPVRPSHPAAGVVLHLTLNRPESRNAMSLAMVDALIDALRAAESAGDVRAIVLRGAGGHFCAGADLRDLAGARVRAGAAGADEDPIAEVNARFGQLCLAYAQTGIATVAVLEGTVMGGGFGLACVVDVALAGETAQFRLPETALGVIPAQIAPFLVERLGYGEAKHLAVTGARLNAQQALALRLVHRVAPAAEVDGALAETLAQLLRCAPGAVAVTKALLRRIRHEPAAALVAPAARMFSEAAQGPEGTEGAAAFLQKRAPSWSPDAEGQA